MKGYPRKFDNTELFSGGTWSVSSQKIEQKYTTEDGYDDVDIIRESKRSISCSFTCTDKWFKFFEEYSLKTKFVFSEYSPTIQGYATYEVRMKDFQYSEMPESDNMTLQGSIYDVSFTLEEY